MAFLGTFHLAPDPVPVPHGELLAAWTHVGFERARCRAIVEALLGARPHLEALLDPRAITDGGLCATRELLLDAHARPRRWRFGIDSGARSLELVVGAEALPGLAALVRAAHVSADAGELRELAGDAVDEALLACLDGCYGEDPARSRWAALDRPGVYRREHASLVFRTEAATLVTDPQSLAKFWTTGMGRSPADPAHEASASVLVSHAHGDHLHLPSILRWLDDGDRVIMPHVPQASLMSDDMPALARALAAPVDAPAWWSTVAVGDVEVDVLPFYGEQATRRLPAPHPALQNWGNCYRINLPGFSVLLLVDSGADARGDMLDVLRRSVAERGPVDVLMSCCFEFPEAVNPGLAHYALAVPFAELERLWRTRESMTLGPDGVVEACAAAQARYFMPYAHGFEGVGRPAGNPDGAGTEAQVLARIAAGLAARGLGTQLVPWNPGDALSWQGGRPVVRGVA